MAFGRSMMSVFGAWVAWVHVLSLLVLLGVPGPEPVAAPRPNVRFRDADAVFTCPAGAARNALAGIEIEISEPLEHDVRIPIRAIRGTASPGEQYDADIDAAGFIRAGETRGGIREREGLRDITVRSEGVAATPLRFTLELQNTHDVVAAPDPQGRRVVELLPGAADPALPQGSRLTAARFDAPLVRVPERDFVDQRFVLHADKPVDADADVHFELRRGIGDAATAVTRFRRTMRQGAAETSFRLSDVLSDEELRELRLADDDVPGPDEFYELHADPRPPLIGHADPCFTTVVVADDDGHVEISQVLEDERGNRLRRVMPGQPFWVVPELSRPLERDCHVVPLVDGRPRPPGGVIPAGELRRPRFGPFMADADRETLAVAASGAAAPNGLPRCGTCAGRPGGCPECRAKGTCRSCQGRPGGCAACRDGKGACRGCCGRPGGCMACGFGQGRCGSCQGAGGSCSTCGGSGGGGGGSGSGAGGGRGGGGGQGAGGGSGDGLVQSAKPRDVHVGPPAQGDFLLLLVNNQRLHEPGDAISAQVLEAIKDEKAYRDAAFVVNEDDETELKPGSPPPAAAATFRPFSREGEDLSGQVGRIADTIAEKRDNAAVERLPTIVVWPERELSSAANLEPLAALAAKGGGPISILCPDADPEKARRLAAALQPPAGAKDRVTVRSPKTPELVEHIRDVIHGGREATPAPPQAPRATP